MSTSFPPIGRLGRRRPGPMHRRPPRLLSVTLTELRCAATTVVLLLRRRLVLPTGEVGRRIRFGDGTKSTIFRETRLLGATATEPVLIVVRFRLRLLGLNRTTHALFRAESLLNTPLFAGQPGFCSKLWLTDLATGFYRGIYEWDGADSARRYGETLRVVLAPYTQRNSFAYRVLPGQSRQEFLAGQTPNEASPPADRWWLPLAQSASAERI